MKTTNAQILLDSVNPAGDRITTFVLTYPRFILSELNTHRALSKSSASSRAIPIEKMIRQVKDNPAIPVRWGRNGKGMQDHGEMVGTEADMCRLEWIQASSLAVMSAHELNSCGLHKGIVNRVLEPFVWMTTILTGTDFENFFYLRVHKTAQPEFQHLAHLMLREYVGSSPKQLGWEDWHIPFGDHMPADASHTDQLKIATARAARVSYMNHDGAASDMVSEFRLHDDLAMSGHWVPFEHSASAVAGRFANFKGWKQYRLTFPNQNRRCDLAKLLETYEQSIKAA